MNHCAYEQVYWVTFLTITPVTRVRVSCEQLAHTKDSSSTPIFHSTRQRCKCICLTMKNWHRQWLQMLSNKIFDFLSQDVRAECRDFEAGHCWLEFLCIIVTVWRKLQLWSVANSTTYYKYVVFALILQSIKLMNGTPLKDFRLQCKRNIWRRRFENVDFIIPVGWTKHITHFLHHYSIHQQIAEKLTPLLL